MDITVNVKVQAPGMTTMDIPTVVSVEARDIIGPITIPAAAVDLEIEVAPGSLTQSKLIFITATDYPAVDPLSYKISLDTNPAVVLSTPHLFMGDQDSLAPGPFDKIFVSNPGLADVNVTILLGRDATP